MPTTKCLVISDLDRTLFDTDRFRSDFLQATGRAALRKGDFPGKAELDAFNAFDLMSASYLYPDTRAFLDTFAAGQIQIITTGNPDWQNFKLDFEPLLRDRPRTILSGNKGEYIRDHILPAFRGEIHLIDDLTANLEPLLEASQVHLWHIQRPDNPRQHTAFCPPNIRHITKLDRFQIR